MDSQTCSAQNSKDKHWDPDLYHELSHLHCSCLFWHFLHQMYPLHWFHFCYYVMYFVLLHILNHFHSVTSHTSRPLYILHDFVCNRKCRFSGICLVFPPYLHLNTLGNLHLLVAPLAGFHQNFNLFFFSYDALLP